MDTTAQTTSLPHSSPVPRRRGILSRLGHDYAFVLPGFVISLIAVILLVPLFALAIGTAVIWVGVWLLPLTLAIATGFAELSRSRARLWGVHLPAIPYRRAGRGVNGPLTLITDPRRWLDLLFETLIAFPLRTVTFCLAVTWTAVAAGGLTYVLWGHYIPRGGREKPLVGGMLEALTDGAVPDALATSYAIESLVYLVLGALFALTLPAIMRGLALLDATATTAALGPEPTSARPVVRQAPDPLATPVA